LPTSTRGSTSRRAISSRTSTSTLADVLEVRPAHSDDELAAALELRERVFCGEQGVSLEADRDGRDPESLHIVAVCDGRVVGTCRLLFNGRLARLGRLVVEPDLRGRGVAGAILREADRAALEGGADRIALHAQTYALSLYTDHGYGQRGARFTEEGIEHVAMEKLL
jgi:predicted GNAT family N-acyltransferase